jgi:hypothetical protein
MGSGRNRSTTPDLFSTASAQEPTPPSVDPRPPSTTTADAASAAPSPRYVLPRDLTRAIKQLADRELDRLLAAALAERERRGGKPPGANEPARKRRVEAGTAPLPLGKLNAVRAAHEAGVTPPQIARYFGLSQSDVRRALAGDRSKGAPSR